MTNQHADVLKTIAIDQVLGGLGPTLANILKYYLEHDHNIVVDSSSGQFACSFERLFAALSSIAGERTAMIILEDIYIELDRLSD